MSRPEPPSPVADCALPPEPGLLAGLRQFNAGEFFACHETLEDLWLAERGPLRSLYQGILQVGVGFHHLQRGNERGAVLLLARGVELLRPFAPACRGVDVAGLIAATELVRSTLAAAGLERTRILLPGLLPQIHFR